MPERPVEKMLKTLKPNEKDLTLSNRKRKMIMDLARQELKKRQKEFLKALRDNTYSERCGEFSTRIYIKLPGSGRVAEMVLYRGDGTSENLLISRLTIGKYEDRRDVLRGLGIGQYLIQWAKEYALRNRYPGLTIDCEEKLVEYYKKFGFKAMSKRQGRNRKIIVEMDFDFPRK